MDPFIELRDRVFAHYFDGRYREALQLVEEFTSEDASQKEDLYFWRMCLQSRLGETDRALATFAEALDVGHWWSETMLADSDLDPLRELPEWGVLLERCRAAARGAPAHQLQPLAIPPPGGTASGPRALVVLHGAGSRPELEADRWEGATGHGWGLIVPQSTQRLSASGRYGWHDLDRARSDVLAQLEETGWLPGGELVLGGFSQGGGLAVHLACTGALAARGVIAVAPSFGEWGIPEPKADRPVPCRILMGEGEHPQRVARVEELREALQGAGWAVVLERLDGVGHGYPGDFPRRLSAALAAVAGPAQPARKSPG